MANTANEGLVGELRPKDSQTIGVDEAQGFGLGSTRYGALLCEDANGTRWTALTEDMEFFRILVKTFDQLDDFRLGARYPLTRRGWPDEWQGPSPE